MVLRQKKKMDLRCPITKEAKELVQLSCKIPLRHEIPNGIGEHSGHLKQIGF